jgi:hypothetical protein
MSINITKIAGNLNQSALPPIFNANFKAVQDYLNQLEAKLNPTSDVLQIRQATVGSAGLTINPASSNPAIIVNASQANSFCVNALGGVETKNFIKSFGSWNAQSPNSYNEIRGVLRVGDIQNTLVSPSSSGFLAEALYPSAQNSLQQIMAVLNPDLDQFKLPANGGTLSQVLRLGNTQLNRRLILSNTGGQRGGRVFNVFEATVPSASVNSVQQPSRLDPSLYGHICPVRIVNAGDSFWVDTSKLEKGESVWIVGTPQSELGRLFIKAESITNTFVAGEFANFDSSVLNGTESDPYFSLNFGKTTRLLVTNVVDGTVQDRLQVWSFMA